MLHPLLDLLRMLGLSGPAAPVPTVRQLVLAADNRSVDMSESRALVFPYENRVTP